MGEANPIRTLGDYSKPSHEGYRNTIELPVGNNVDLLQKVPYHGIDLWLQVQIFYDHVNPVTRRTIDHLTDSKLRDKNTKESWALLEDLALYDNESWNEQRDFAISLPQDVLMNKITTSCEICSGPYDTQYCMEDPEQAFVEYASLHTDEAGASQDARLSKFEADFKQQQSDMTNKIDIVLKAITDRIAGSLPSDMVRNPKLNVNTTTSVLSARSYPTIDPQCLSHPSISINPIKTCSKEANISQTSQLQPRIGSGTQQPEEPEPTLEDEF
ncbi:hypothetical protein Tco_1144285 [Tanacetum coccineum]